MVYGVFVGRIKTMANDRELKTNTIIFKLNLAKKKKKCPGE